MAAQLKSVSFVILLALATFAQTLAANTSNFLTYLRNHSVNPLCADDESNGVIKKRDFFGCEFDLDC